jgi:hypothetical protein
MITIFASVSVYAGGCVFAMMFFLLGRWPALMERNWQWPVIFLWPMVVLWPVRNYFVRAEDRCDRPVNSR